MISAITPPDIFPISPALFRYIHIPVVSFVEAECAGHERTDLRVDCEYFFSVTGLAEFDDSDRTGQGDTMLGYGLVNFRNAWTIPSGLFDGLLQFSAGLFDGIESAALYLDHQTGHGKPHQVVQ